MVFKNNDNNKDKNNNKKMKNLFDLTKVFHALWQTAA